MKPKTQFKLDSEKLTKIEEMCKTGVTVTLGQPHLTIRNEQRINIQFMVSIRFDNWNGYYIVRATLFANGQFVRDYESRDERLEPALVEVLDHCLGIADAISSAIFNSFMSTVLPVYKGTSLRDDVKKMLEEIKCG
jgi:hypothetical protein